MKYQTGKGIQLVFEFSFTVNDIVPETSDLSTIARLEERTKGSDVGDITSG